MDLALEKYNYKYCQCSYPRFIQIVSIDCFEYGHSFKSIETELLIEKSLNYFERKAIEKTGECHSETWKCKKCNSEYELSWSDMSIALDRQTLKPKNIKAKIIGKKNETPIPLYKGLVGYSYPSKSEIVNVEYETFEKYILEK